MAAILCRLRRAAVLHKIAWAVIVLVPLVMLPFAVWLWDRLVRQQQVRNALSIVLKACAPTSKRLTKAQTEPKPT